jgi:hypothetical protein
LFGSYVSRKTSSDWIWNFSMLEVTEHERHIDRPYHEIQSENNRT